MKRKKKTKIIYSIRVWNDNRWHNGEAKLYKKTADWEMLVGDLKSEAVAKRYFLLELGNMKGRFGLFKNSKLVGELKVKRNKVEVICEK